MQFIFKTKKMGSNTDKTDPIPVPESIDYFKREYPNIFKEVHFESSQAYKPYVLLEKLPTAGCPTFRFVLTPAGIVTMKGHFSAIWGIEENQKNIIEIINNFANTQQDFSCSGKGTQDYFLNIAGEKSIQLSYVQYVSDIKDSSLIPVLEDTHRYDNISTTPVE
jgi:hypothetical protein